MKTNTTIALGMSALTIAAFAGTASADTATERIVSERAAAISEGYAPSEAALEAMERMEIALDAATPDYDVSLLSVAGESGDWMATLSLDQIAAAAGDIAPSSPAIAGERVEATDEIRGIKFDRDKGFVRYVSTERGFDFQSSPRLGVGRERSLRVVFEALDELEVPVHEGQTDLDVAEVEMQWAPVGDDTQRATATRATMVTLERKIAGVPVVDARIRATVSNRGELARMRVHWPAFSLAPELSEMRDRQEVIEEAIGWIVAQEEQPRQIASRIVFAPTARGYVPSLEVHIGVDEGNTPFGIAVPLAR